MRALKFLFGLLLLPVCGALTHTVLLLARHLPEGVRQVSPISPWGLAIGFALWIVLFFALPRPTRTYVLAHELTHALWALLLGVKVVSLKVGERQGRVGIERGHFLIALAPYFFPLYTVLVILLHAGLSLFYDLRVYEPFWLGLVGLTWAFHLTFTVQMLATHQSDIAEQGYLFSYAFIYAANVFGIALWIIAVAPPTLGDYAAQLARDLHAAWTLLAGTAVHVLQHPRG